MIWQHRELGAQDEGPSNTLAPGPAPLSFASVLKTVTFGTGQGLLLETIKRDSGSRFHNLDLLEIRRPLERPSILCRKVYLWF